MWLSAETARLRMVVSECNLLGSPIYLWTGGIIRRAWIHHFHHNWNAIQYKLNNTGNLKKQYIWLTTNTTGATNNATYGTTEHAIATVVMMKLWCQRCFNYWLLGTLYTGPLHSHLVTGFPQQGHRTTNAKLRTSWTVNSLLMKRRYANRSQTYCHSMDLYSHNSIVISCQKWRRLHSPLRNRT